MQHVLHVCSTRCVSNMWSVHARHGQCMQYVLSVCSTCSASATCVQCMQHMLSVCSACPVHATHAQCMQHMLTVCSACSVHATRAQCVQCMLAVCNVLSVCNTLLMSAAHAQCMQHVLSTCNMCSAPATCAQRMQPVLRICIFAHAPTSAAAAPCCTCSFATRSLSARPRAPVCTPSLFLGDIWGHRTLSSTQSRQHPVVYAPCMPECCSVPQFPLHKGLSSCIPLITQLS